MTSAHSQSRLPQPWWRAKLSEVVGIDPRSLALFRISLGLILLVDLATRASDFGAFYGPEGFLSVAESIRESGPWSWSLYWLSESPWLVAAGMVAAACCAAAMLAGYQTRWATALSWVLLVSLQNRNPLVLNAGDTLLRLLLFWSIFLPLGKIWSLDSRRSNRRIEDKLDPVLSPATLAILVQVALMYWMSGLIKMNGMWLGFNPWDVAADPASLRDTTVGGPALIRTFGYDMYTRPLAGVLLQHPEMLRWMALGTVALEFGGPMLLFSPLLTRYVRVLLIVGFLLLHAGIELTLHVGLFSYVALAGWTVFIPGMVWDHRLLARLSADGSRRGGLSTEGTVAAPQLSRGLTLARCAGRFFSGAIVLGLLWVVFAWNFTTLVNDKVRRELQRPLRPIVNATVIRQQWNMFSHPILADAWLVFAARLHNGREVDLIRRGTQVSFTKPADSALLFPNHRWRKLHAALDGKRFRRYRRNLAEFHVRQWNATHPPDEQVKVVKLYRVFERRGAERPAQPGSKLFDTLTVK